MKIADGLEVLKISTYSMGGPGVIHPTLIWDENTVILVDAGLPGQLQSIREAMEKSGVSFDRLDRVIITHQDMDHIGSLSSIVNESGRKVKVMAHGVEKPYITGEKRPIKMTPERIAQLEAQLKAMPEEKRNEMKRMYTNLPTNVDVLVEDGEELPYCGGIRIIHTPGHTPGHICLYLERYKALVTGDALMAVDGQLYGPSPQHTFDMEAALKSLKKLMQYDIQTIICYHGGVYRDNANQRIAELAGGK